MPVGLEGKLENGEEKTHTASSERGRKRVVLPPSTIIWEIRIDERALLIIMKIP